MSLLLSHWYILGQVWNLIVSIPDPCILNYFIKTLMNADQIYSYLGLIANKTLSMEAKINTFTLSKKI